MQYGASDCLRLSVVRSASSAPDTSPERDGIEAFLSSVDPNPFQESTTIQFMSQSAFTDAFLMVYNQDGELVFQSDIDEAGAGSFQI